MKGKVILAGIAAALMIAAPPAMSDYLDIQHNLFDGVPDTSFDPGTGVFSINAVNAGLLTLNDPTALGGGKSNVMMSLTANFDQVIPPNLDWPDGAAKFINGFFTLSFDYDGDGVGGDPATAHSISGPINGIFFTIAQVGPNSRIDGLGRWIAENVDLPSAAWPAVPGVWPDGGGFSSIDSLSIAFAQDLSTFDWTTPLQGSVETLYSLFPDDRAVPEPSSLAIVLLGGLALARRRR